jgi:hypothetical protein
MIATNGLQYDIALHSGLQTRLAAPRNRNGPAASIASRKGGIHVLAVPLHSGNQRKKKSPASLPRATGGTLAASRPRPLIRPFCITILYHNLLLFIDIFYI